MNRGEKTVAYIDAELEEFPVSEDGMAVSEDHHFGASPSVINAYALWL